MAYTSPLLVGGLVVLGLFIYRQNRPSRLPPVLPGSPVIGNLPQLLSISHVKLDEYKDILGPIYTLKVPGQTIVVLCNAKIAADILDKMSAVTSDRPDWLMAASLMSRRMLLSTLKYDAQWRKHRRGAHEAMNVKAAESFYPVQEDEAYILVRGLIYGEKRDDLELHMRRAAASTVWRALYGGPPLPLVGSATLVEIDDIADRMLVALSPGGGIVDVIPPLMYVPEFLAPYKQYASKFYDRANKFFLGLYEEACTRKQVADDPNVLNLCAALNERKKELNLADDDVAWLSGMMFLGGAETTSTVLQYFVLAMILYPAVAEKAQAEIDSVCGPNHPPRFADRPRLPYIEAMVKEVLRWRPVVAIGAPHVATQDFVYMDYTIPKGTMILNNLWSICRDPLLFPSPETFQPERFLSPSPSNSTTSAPERFDDLAFGYGRRICIGQHVASNSLFIDLAVLLWAFRFGKAVDGEGKEVEVDAMKFKNTGGTVRPEKFGFKVEVRNEEVGRFLEQYSG